MIKLTENEKLTLNEITKDNFYEQGLDSCVWSDCFIDDTSSLEGKIVRGVLSSLIKKDIIYPIGKNRDEQYIAFTEVGKTLMQELGYK